MSNHNATGILKRIFDEIEERFSPSSSKMKKHFHKMIENDKKNNKIKNVHYIQDIKDVIDSYYKNKNVLKQYVNIDKGNNNYFNIMDDNKTNLAWHEYVGDSISKLKEHSAVKKYAGSYLRSYKSLLNDESLSLFKVLMDKDLEREDLSKKLSKIAAYDTEDLNKALSKIVEDVSLSADSIINKINDEDLNATVLENENNTLTVMIGDYDASEKLGSSQWCISYNQSNYETYLDSTKDEYDSMPERYENDDRYRIVDDALNENVLPGNHVFVWDFSKAETDPNFKIAFTVSSAGDVVAAHDQEDECILEDFDNRTIYSEECAYIAQDGYDYFMKRYKDEDLDNWDHIYAKPFDVISNVAYPLSFYRHITDNLDRTDIEPYDDGFLLPEELLTKTLDDHKLFKFRKTEDVLEDVLWLSEFISEFKKWEPEEVEPDEDGYFNHGEIESIPFMCYFDDAQEVLKKGEFFEMIKTIPASSAYLLFKKDDNKKRIISALENDIKTIKNKDIMDILKTNRMLTFHNSYKKEEDKFNFLSQNSDIFDLSNDEKTYSIMASLKKDDEMGNLKEEYICNEIKKGNLHPNHILRNINRIHEDSLPIILNEVSQLNKSGMEFNLTAVEIMEMSKSQEFINNIDEKTVILIKKSIGVDKSTFGKFTSKGNNNKIFFEDYSFGQKMNSLYRVGIIDEKSFMNNFDKGELCFGDQASFPKDEFKSLEEYIFSGDCVHLKKKKQLKLKF